MSLKLQSSQALKILITKEQKLSSSKAQNFKAPHSKALIEAPKLSSYQAPML